MQVLGAANLSMSGKQAYDAASAVASGGTLSYGVSVNLSRNTSQSTSVTTSSQAVGSGIVGTNNVNIVATGGGADSNLHAVGSTIAAGNTVNLAADNAITLEASRNSSVTAGSNSSHGENVGVTFGAGAQTGLSIQLGVSQGKGRNNQDDVSYNDTHMSGGKAVNISSGGNLTLSGAVVDANRVTADVGGNLNITSLQDVSVGSSRQSSGGLNVSLCIPPICYSVVATASVSASGAKANGVFVSPNEQSGIKAGDGGFDVNVKGNTDMVGAVIESTQAAINGGKNSFATEGALTMSDLQNQSSSSGSSFAVSGGECGVHDRSNSGDGHGTSQRRDFGLGSAQGSGWQHPHRQCRNWQLQRQQQERHHEVRDLGHCWSPGRADRGWPQRGHTGEGLEYADQHQGGAGAGAVDAAVQPERGKGDRDVCRQAGRRPACPGQVRDAPRKAAGSKSANKKAAGVPV